MPIKIENLDDGLGVLFVGEDSVSGSDLIRANETIFSSVERMKKYKYGIIDYSDITQFEVSASETETIASQDMKASEYIPHGFVAIIVKTDLEFGVSRMWETIIENYGLPWETDIFRERKDAEKWVKKKVKEKYNIDLSLL